MFSCRLESHLQLMHMGKLPVSGGEQLVNLFEDLHWILMITGNWMGNTTTQIRLDIWILLAWIIKKIWYKFINVRYQTFKNLYSGHFLAIDCTEGETIMIPSEIIRYSISEHADLDASLRYLVGVSTDTDNVDPILK